MGEKTDRKFEEDVKKGRTPFMEFAKWKKTESFFKEGVTRGEVTEDDILYIQAYSIMGLLQKPGGSISSNTYGPGS